MGSSHAVHSSVAADASSVRTDLLAPSSPNAPRNAGTATLRMRSALVTLTRASAARNRIAAAAASTSLPTAESFASAPGVVRIRPYAAEPFRPAKTLASLPSSASVEVWLGGVNPRIASSKPAPK